MEEGSSVGAAGQDLLFAFPGKVRAACSGTSESGHLTITSWVNAAVAVADFLCSVRVTSMIVLCGFLGFE